MTSICGAKHAEEADLKTFSGLCESVRNDVECLFGILKKRFRCLGAASLAHFTTNIDNMVKICNILHNMLLGHDGLDVVGEGDSDWKNVDEEDALAFGVRLANLATFVLGSQSEYNDMDQMEVNDGWDAKMRDLVSHYVHALRRGGVYALRTMTERALHADEE